MGVRSTRLTGSLLRLKLMYYHVSTESHLHPYAPAEYTRSTCMSNYRRSCWAAYDLVFSQLLFPGPKQDIKFWVTHGHLKYENELGT